MPSGISTPKSKMPEGLGWSADSQAVHLSVRRDNAADDHHREEDDEQADELGGQDDTSDVGRKVVDAGALELVHRPRRECYRMPTRGEGDPEDARCEDELPESDEDCNREHAITYVSGGSPLTFVRLIAVRVGHDDSLESYLRRLP